VHFISFRSVPAQPRTLYGALLAALMAIVAAPASADPYPDKPVRLILHTTPAGAADVVARALATRLAVRLGKPVVVENRPGAGGALGMGLVAKAVPDGYTIGMVTNAFATMAQLRPNLNFNPATDLTPIAFIGSVPYYFLARADAPFKTIDEMLAYAKNHPGKVSFASAGTGTVSHLLPTSFQNSRGVVLNHIPYSGAAPALNSVLGGQVDMYIDPVMTSVEHVKLGKLRALAVTGTTRSKATPSVPTLAEAGVPIRAVTWFGIMAPAGVPQPILDRLNTEINATLQEDEIRKLFQGMQIEIETGPPSRFSTFANAEMELWGKIVRDSGIKAE
jgi:tripartite-type tricarboxylate transporter receptor subunit TctC